MSQDQGNARQKTAAGKDEIRMGDIVCLTPEAIKSAPRLMGPVKLYSIGWPNAFQVVHTFLTEENRPYVTISGCCYNLVVNRKTGMRLCSGHDVKWFKKLYTPGEEDETATEQEEQADAQAPKRDRHPGDRLTSLEVPLAGEVAAVEYLHDDANPLLVLRFLKQKIAINGKVAEAIAKAGKEHGFF